jgi:O-antigen ligase
MAVMQHWFVGLLVSLFVGWLMGSAIAAKANALSHPLTNQPTAVPREFGITLDLTSLNASERATFFQQAPASRVRWVRQVIAWRTIEPQRGAFTWARMDDAINEAYERGYRVLAVLQDAPAWARAPSTAATAPPKEWRDFGAFARAVATRYRGKIAAYQIWDEPNLAANWGDQFPNALAYTALLREAAIVIRDADPQARLVTAALAPTTENGPLNIAEPEFLQRLYRAGARDFFDAVGAEPFGFWSDADDPRVAVNVLNFSRLQLLRGVMVANGDGDKALWATAFGWVVGKPGDSPLGGDTAEKQTRRTLHAIRRARDEWLWLGPLMFARWQPLGNGDAREGLSLWQSDGTPSLLWQQFNALTNDFNVATVGRYTANDASATYSQTWRITADGADIPQGDATPLVIRFRGTRFDLTVRRGMYEAVLFAQVDGAPANALPRDEQDRSYVVLYDPLAQVATVTLARHLSDDTHIVELIPQGGWGQWALVGWSVMREEHTAWWWPWLGAFTGAVLFLIFDFRFLIFNWKKSNVRVWFRNSQLATRFALHASRFTLHASRFTSLIEPYSLLITFSLAILIYFSPNTFLSFALIALLAVCIIWRLDVGLALVAFVIPFYLQPKPLIGGVYSLVEIVTWLCVLSFILHWIKTHWDKGQGLRGFAALPSLHPFTVSSLDWCVLLWLVAGIGGVLSAQNFGVANRELRVVFLEPALYYGLIRATRPNAMLLVHAFLAGACLISLKALGDWFTGADLITAEEGMLRARSVYFSPNNLALYLDRAAPLAMSLMWFSAARRWWYGMASIVMLSAIYLTFSKGSWFVALPAALLLIGGLRGRKVFIASLIALGALGAALSPFIGVARLRLDAITSVFRAQLWQSTLAMIRDYPITGVGLDNFLYLYRTRYILPTAFAEANLSHPHNLLLDFWTRLGLLGVVLLGALLIAFWRHALTHYRRPSDETARALTLGLMASMLAAVAHGLIDNSFFLVDLAFVLMLTLAILQVKSNES